MATIDKCAKIGYGGKCCLLLIRRRKMLGKDQYIVNSKRTLIDNYQQLVAVFYLPLVGANAVSLYYLLAAEIKRSQYNSIERLCVLTSLNIDELENNIHLLEQYRLLNTFKKDYKYVFVLSNPLNAQDFFDDPTFSRLYMRKVGVDQYYISYNKYVDKKVDTDKMENISQKLDLSILNDWDSQEEKLLNMESKKNDKLDITINFDYDSFFKIIDASELTRLPQQYRDQDFTEYIGYLATYYNITPRLMAAIVSRCINDNYGVLDKDDLKRACVSSNNLVAKNRETKEYDTSPVNFLSDILQRPVTNSEDKLIETLKSDYGLKNDVINVLIEYTLRKCKKKFSKPFALSVADSWHNENIDTVEKAKDIIEQFEKKSEKSNSNKTQYSFDDMDVQQTDIEKLRKELFSKG